MTMATMETSPVASGTAKMALDQLSQIDTLLNHVEEEVAARQRESKPLGAPTLAIDGLRFNENTILVIESRRSNLGLLCLLGVP